MSCAARDGGWGRSAGTRYVGGAGSGVGSGAGGAATGGAFENADASEVWTGRDGPALRAPGAGATTCGVGKAPAAVAKYPAGPASDEALRRQRRARAAGRRRLRGWEGGGRAVGDGAAGRRERAAGRPPAVGSGRGGRPSRGQRRGLVRPVLVRRARRDARGRHLEPGRRRQVGGGRGDVLGDPGGGAPRAPARRDVGERQRGVLARGRHDRGSGCGAGGAQGPAGAGDAGHDQVADPDAERHDHGLRDGRTRLGGPARPGWRAAARRRPGGRVRSAPLARRWARARSR